MQLDSESQGRLERRFHDPLCHIPRYYRLDPTTGKVRTVTVKAMPCKPLIVDGKIACR